MQEAASLLADKKRDIHTVVVDLPLMVFDKIFLYSESKEFAREK